MAYSCATYNDSQGATLRNPLTTGTGGIGTLATMNKRPRKPGSAVVAEIYAKRQVRRPHYLDKLMVRHDVDRADLVEKLGVDKSQLSRWLDDDHPSTPSPQWAEKLGWYFAAGGEPDDFVDIFTDPDLARFQRLARKMDEEKVNAWLSSLEASLKVNPPRKGG